MTHQVCPVLNGFLQVRGRKTIIDIQDQVVLPGQLSNPFQVNELQSGIGGGSRKNLFRFLGIGPSPFSGRGAAQLVRGDPPRREKRVTQWLGETKMGRTGHHVYNEASSPVKGSESGEKAKER